MKRHNVVRIKWMMAGVVAYMFVAAIAIGEEAFVMKDPIHEFNGIKYAETGVAESKEDERWKTATLVLEFATVHAELYSDIAVSISDSSGKAIFQKTINSPWLVLWLKPGTYKVHLTDKKGVSKSATVQVTKSYQMKTFKW